jgi:hypothetical protein
VFDVSVTKDSVPFACWRRAHSDMQLVALNIARIAVRPVSTSLLCAH